LVIVCKYYTINSDKIIIITINRMNRNKNNKISKKVKLLLNNNNKQLNNKHLIN